jgi:RHS repeat-associated protein
MTSTDLQASQGEACLPSKPVSWPEETVPENPQASYYRARYYDSATGRFLSEDPDQFSAGNNFFPYVKNNPVNFVDPFGLNPGAVALPWWWWILDNPISIPIITVGAGGAGIIIGIGEAVLAPATGIDDARAIPKTKNPAPDCDKGKRDACKAQYIKDLEWCDFMFANNLALYFACTAIADQNLENCLNGKPRVDPDPQTPKGPPNKKPIPFPNKPRSK